MAVLFNLNFQYSFSLFSTDIVVIFFQKSEGNSLFSIAYHFWFSLLVDKQKIFFSSKLKNFEGKSLNFIPKSLLV